MFDHGGDPGRLGRLLRGTLQKLLQEYLGYAVRAANLDGADFSGDQHLADILTGRMQIRCKRCNGQNVGKIVKSGGIGNSDLGFHDNNLHFLA